MRIITDSEREIVQHLCAKLYVAWKWDLAWAIIAKFSTDVVHSSRWPSLERDYRSRSHDYDTEIEHLELT